MADKAAKLMSIWTVAQAKKFLLPATDELLDIGREKTFSHTVRLALVPRPIPADQPIAPFHAVGKFAESPAIQNQTDSLEMRALKKKRPIGRKDVFLSDEWRTEKERAESAGDQDLIALLNSFRSDLVVPLFGERRDRPLGVLHFFHEHPGGYEPQSVIDNIHFLSRSTAKALENTIRYCFDLQRPDWEERLNRSTNDVPLRPVHVESVCEFIVRKALEIAHAEVAALWLLSAPTNEFVLASLHNAEFIPPDFKLHFRSDARVGFRGAALATKKPHYCEDTSKDDYKGRWSKCIPGVRTSYTMPLVNEGTSFGVLCVDSYRRDAFCKELRDTLDVLSCKAGILLGSIIQKAQEVAKQKYWPDLIRASNREAMCSLAVDQVREIAKAESATLFLTAPEGSQLNLAATTGLAPGHTAGSYALGEGITGWVAKERVPLRLKNCGDPKELMHWGKDLHWMGKLREAASSGGFERPHLSVPVLTTNGECIGVIRASGKRQAEIFPQFTEEDKIRLTQWAPYFAMELVRSDQDVAKPSDPEVFFQHILSRCLADCGVESGSISFIEEGRQILHVSHAGNLIKQEEDLSLTLTAETGVTGVCALSGKAQLVEDVAEGYWKSIYIPCFANTQSEMTIPVIVQGKVVLVINLESKQVGHFTSEHQARVEKVAEDISNYIHAEQSANRWARLRTHLLLKRALRAYRRDLDQLLQHHQGEWVAYHGVMQVGFAQTKVEMYQICQAKRLSLKEVLLRSVELEMGEGLIGPGMIEIGANDTV